jgi:hypothetical protein
MSDNPPAQGWYHDPYGIHQDRWFSQGRPTKLVRDGTRESYDPAPGQPPPEGDLVPAGQRGEEARDGADLRRADDVGSDPYDPAAARQAAFNLFDMTSGQT